jgi:serine/threonine protein kinase
MTIVESDYYTYLHGGLLHDRYERVKGLNEGSFGIVSIAKDTKDNNKLVAVKYNTGRLSDFEAYQNQQPPHSNGIDIRSISLDSKTKSVIRTNSAYSHTQNSEKDVSKSIVLRETLQEILMLKKVDSHPNITKLIDSFDTFMILEYAPRGDLHDAIQLGIAPVATRDVIDVFMQLISAVEFCHKNGVYHRDIKPENILIDEDWSIKLTDFGLATDHLICTDFDVGSERYMAPELLEHSDISSYAADKVDIWALGICLLNIVFGKSPFRSASSKDKMFLHFAANRETLFDIFPFMSYDLFSVMIHSLTIDPANRDLEMIKRTLMNIDVLTYDYEFEEEVEDIKDKPLVEEKEEEDEEKEKGKEEAEETEETEEAGKVGSINYEISDRIENIEEKENDRPIRESSTDSHINFKPELFVENTENTGNKENKDISKVEIKESNKVELKNSNALEASNLNHVSRIMYERDMESVNSIDTLIESDLEPTVGKNSVSKPITIQKKYEPPHRFLSSTSLNRYANELKKSNKRNNNNTNNNNNNNFRAKRWNPAHRKPLRIANYNYRNKSQGREPLKDDAFDFNRKDFFTPKSVFSHYMEKANRGKQQLQQRGAYYRKFKDYDSALSNHNYSYKNINNGNNSHNYHNSNYGDRRAWQKRKRRSSHISYNNSNLKNKGGYKGNNVKSKNNRNDGANWSHNIDQHSSGQRRLSSNITNLVRLSSSMRSSIDGKYVPPNLRLNASQLMGSAIYSDDEYEPDHDTKIDNKLHDVRDDNDDVFDSGDTEEDDYEEDGFSFEFEQSMNNNKSHDFSNHKPVDGKMFQQIQSNAINILTKQFVDSRIFDEKNGTSRDGSLATTVSNNHSSIGSNLNTSPKSGYKKYVPPHHRRSSHGADIITKPIINNNINIPITNMINNFNGLSQISSSAPTKSSAFFHLSSKLVNPHELLANSRTDNSDEHSDDLFDIEEN